MERTHRDKDRLFRWLSIGVGGRGRSSVGRHICATLLPKASFLEAGVDCKTGAVRLGGPISSSEPSSYPLVMWSFIFLCQSHFPLLAFTPARAEALSKAKSRQKRADGERHFSLRNMGWCSGHLPCVHEVAAPVHRDR